MPGSLVRLAHRASVSVCLLALSLAAVSCERKPPPAASVSSAWRDFEGSWNAAGTRRTIPLGDQRKGSIVDLRGSMLLAGTDRPGVGFRAELIALVDTKTGLLGRGVWTDEHGDQVFSELKGEGTKEKNHITGTILGGTGRFAAVEGTFEFSWQFLIESEDGSIQGRAEGLKGRCRLAPPAAGGAAAEGAKQ